MALSFDRTFDGRHGEVVPVAPGVARVTAPNPSAFTFHGTNSYLVGNETLAVIDPGPDDDAHLAALLAAIAGRPVSHILVTHSHRDHAPLAARLKAATGAPIAAQGPYVPAAGTAATAGPDAGHDETFRPDLVLAEGATIGGDGWSLETVLTPGHAANHASFALSGTGLLFSGDHVMAWSTSIVIPPDGSMRDYMASLDRLMQRGGRMLLPGHGGPVHDPATWLPGLRDHRLAREAAILSAIRGGATTLRQVVEIVYADTDRALHGAAALSAAAHVIHLAEQGLAAMDGDVLRGGAIRAR